MSAADGGRMLTSWKEIAGFFGKSVRTVQRWERMLGLPVHRPGKNLSGIVLADPAQLEAWLRAQPETGEVRSPHACTRCAELEAELTALQARYAALERPALDAPRRRPQPAA